MKRFRHCSKYYKSEFKNVEAVKERVEKLTSSTDQEEALIDRDMNLQNFNST